MPQLDDVDTSDDELPFSDLNSPASVEIKQLIAKLQHANELQYKLINLEAWALAATMDGFLPGFWSRFLANRRAVMKQFLHKKQISKFQRGNGK